jgi:excisionase family DNA binding protein
MISNNGSLYCQISDDWANFAFKTHRLVLLIKLFKQNADILININHKELRATMAVSQKTLPVSQAAALCGVGRTTVGYWIRSKKLRANRVGRNYSIPVQDLLYFLKSSGQKIPSELHDENLKGKLRAVHCL